MKQTAEEVQEHSLLHEADGDLHAAISIRNAVQSSPHNASDLKQ